jgi:hypothetical protein
MSWDTLISIGPMIGGAVLLAICLVSILRNPGVSNTYAVLLGFGALLFAVPIFADFSFKGGAFEVSARVATRQAVANQGAEIKGILADLKTELDHVDQGIVTLARVSNVALPSRTADRDNNRKSTVVIVYSDAEQKKLAFEIERDLLQKGYAANSIYSDFAELPTSKKGPAGSMEFVYTAATRTVANAVREALPQEARRLTVVPDDVRDKMAADVEILLF